MLRPYQTRLIDEIRRASLQHRRILAVAPTGAGKTQIFCEIAGRVRSRGGSVLILVHRRELLDQARNRLQNLGITGVQVETIQSWVPHVYDLIIIDEAHHATARTWHAKLMGFDGLLFGFTATPERLDGKGLSDVFEAMVLGPTTAQLMQQGFLSSYRIFCPPGRADVAGIEKRRGDYVRSQLQERVAQRRVLTAAVRNYRLYAGGRQAIGFCVSVAHMELMRDAFREAGIEAGCVDGRMSRVDRGRVLDGFRERRIRVLLSVDLISEGFDVPSCDCVLLMRPTSSLGLYLQQIGRGLRPSDQSCVILDCAGNSELHGLPDEDREWSLAGGASRQGTGASPVAIRLCPQCYSVHRPSKSCPYCGFVHPVDHRIPAEEEIDLVDRTEDLRLKRREVGGARTLEELQRIAAERGYKPGWAHRVMAARCAGRITS